MASNVSVPEVILRELQELPHPHDYLTHTDGLPYGLSEMLTTKGRAYAERPENLERYWEMHAGTFKPQPFEGTYSRGEGVGGGDTEFKVRVEAFSVLVIVARPEEQGGGSS